MWGFLLADRQSGTDRQDGQTEALLNARYCKTGSICNQQQGRLVRERVSSN